MSSIDTTLSLVRAVLSGGFSIYAYMTYLKLKGGKMSEPYLVFVVCGIVGGLSAVSDATGYEVAHGLLGIVFFILLFLGCWSIYQTWTSFGKMT